MNRLALLCRYRLAAPVLLLFAALVVAACGSGDAVPDPVADPEPKETPIRAEEGELVVYAGRSKNLVEPAFEAFTEQTGIKVRVRYGGSAELAATILEEGGNSPADLVFMQDAGALGALSEAGVLRRLPQVLLDRVDARFRSGDGLWVGTSGRARVVVYNRERIDPQRDLPDTILGFTDPRWEDRIGWPPTNGSFQAFVTAMRLELGDEAAREWLEGIEANDPKVYGNNTSTVAAVASGEVDVGFVNHYYLHRFLAERGEEFGARNFYYTGGDVGALLNVAGVGILETSDAVTAAERFVDYMLSPEAQRYFAEETFEFPLLPGVPSPSGVPSLETLNPTDIDLSSLEDLRGTLGLLRDAGVLP